MPIFASSKDCRASLRPMKVKPGNASTAELSSSEFNSDQCSQDFVSSLDVDNINTSFLDDKNRLPLVISPRFDDSLEFLCQWLVANRSWVDEKMLAHGAVLIRGFQVNTPPEFERAISSVQPNLSNSYRGTSPRFVFDGTKFMFSAADVPVNYPIGQHVEMSFLRYP